MREIKKQIEVLPNKPGVYKYFDKDGDILYIGKAKDLKKRVSSYFTSKINASHRIMMMVSRINQIDYTVVNSEYDALLLENSLIKKYQPRYNINLKDQKTYPFIVIKNERFPRIFPTRNKSHDGEYFGPYASVSNMHQVMEMVRKLFPIRTCNFDLSEKNIQEGKFRICLEYHIDLCKGPCEGLQSEEDYMDNINNIRDILKGNSGKVLKKLKSLMDKAVTNLEFEKAANLKKKMEALQNFQARSTVANPKISDVDVFSIHTDDNQSFVNYLKIKNGAIIQTETVEYKQKVEEEDRDILLLAIAELREKYNSKAKEVLVPFKVNLETEDFQFKVPKIGDKKKLLDLSKKNAYYFYQDKIKQDRAELPKTARIKQFLEKVQRDLGLSKIPYHIECFDNSNIQGTNPVSAMVCFKDGKPSKKDYRHFNIKTVQGPDDFASMEEVVYRRYSRLLKEEQPLPQLIVIDGGKGQLNAAIKSLVKLDIEDQVNIIGIAKRLEEIYKPGDPYPLGLDKRSETLKLIQNMRNEAHRFGITHHRKRRIKKSIKNQLQEIPGIGPQTAKRILNHFKSIKKVKEAEIEELANLVGKDKAEKIKKYFSENVISDH